MKKLLLIISLIFLILPISVGAVPIGLSIMPAKIELKGEKGGKIESSIIITNPNDFSIKVETEIEDFVPGNLPGDIKFVSPGGEFSLANWIELEKKSFSLGPKQREKVSFFVNIPSNASPGGHYSAIFFKGSPEELESGGPIDISGRIGALVMLTVKGEVYKKIEILKFRAPKFISSGPVKFDILIKNKGTSHFIPLGNIKIKDWLGKSIVAVGVEEKTIFPGGTQNLFASWPKKFLLGKYTAILTIDREEENIYSKTCSFWAFPWKQLLGVIVIILIVFFGLKWFKGKFRIVRR